jgi:hypothetical protein
MTVKSFKELKRVFSKNPNLYKADGQDHVRISPYGNTELGKWLSPEFSRKVIVPPLGEFASVRNLWIWLTTDGHPDQVRSVNPKSLERWVKSIKVKKGNSLRLFGEIICYAKYQQFLQHKPKLTDAGLPLLVYQESKEGFRTTMPYEQWYVSAVRNAMDAYLNGTKLVFSDGRNELDFEAYLRDDIMIDLFQIHTGEGRQSTPQVQAVAPSADHRNHVSALETTSEEVSEDKQDSYRDPTDEEATTEAS